MRPTARNAAAIPSATILLSIVLSVAAACATAPKKSAAMKIAPRVEASVSEVRTRVRALAGRFCGLVEEVSDQVSATSTDPALRRATLLVKTNVIPLLQEALFRPDPLEASFDAWALIAQLEDRSVPRDDLGISASAAALFGETCRKMESEIEAVYVKIAPSADLAAVRGRVHAWAAEHPLGDTLASRESPRALFAALEPDHAGSLAVLASLPETLDDTMIRVDNYVRFVPKLARWQGELLAGDLAAGPPIHGALDELANASDSVERISRVVDQMPGLVTSEREAVLRAITAERIAAFEAVRRERLETLAFVDGQRELITKDLTAGHGILLDDIRREHLALVDAVEQMRRGLILESADRLQLIVDRTILRAAVVLAALGLAAFVGAFVLIRFARRPV